MMVPDTSKSDAIAENRATERVWNAEVIAAFRTNVGEVEAPYDDPPPVLLLHTIGARSGHEHVVPMLSLTVGNWRYLTISVNRLDPRVM